MYHDYFGFSEQPFSIAPDPRFLYLGARHQEALQHLRHGLMGSGGFLLLTGEVGMGKTTLSRAVLGELQDQLDVVFVLNPRLSETELLATIAQGFGLQDYSERDSLKKLTDGISQYLQSAAQANRHPVVLIDEAQHLLPSVLEQLRLLTNLESDSRKLLSVVLIGQPELRELLQRPELRQVAQRIVARYQLLPLTAEETFAYLDHRLMVVGGRSELFDPAARKAIYVLTQGIPRLINLLCDRALQLTAQRSLQLVTKAIVHDAAEILPNSPVHLSRTLHGRWHANWWTKGAAVLGVSALLGVSWWLTFGQQTEPEVGPSVSTRTIEGMPLQVAFRELAELWELPASSLTRQPCRQIERYNLACMGGQATLEHLRLIDRPVILALPGRDAQVIVRGVQGSDWLVQDKQGQFTISDAELSQLMTHGVLGFYPMPSQFYDSDSRAWSQYVAQTFATHAPYSLRAARVSQQQRWLEDMTAGIAEDDSWQLAWLSLGLNQLAGPRLSVHDYTLSNEFWQRGTGEVDLGQVARDGIEYPDLTFAWQEVGASTVQMRWVRDDDSENPREQSDPRQDESMQRSTAALPTTRSAASTNEGQRVEMNLGDENVEPPEHLRMLFADALRELEREEAERDHEASRYEINPDWDEPAPPQRASASDAQLPFARDLPDHVQQRIPRLSYDSHVYNSNPNDRWIRLDGRQLMENDRMGDLSVIAIRPGFTIFSIGNTLFRVDALDDI
ncbi:MAG: AAA family ATPase [Idiomarina sp.]|nr:AAA family ATPase [Idiomarina sp.]